MSLRKIILVVFLFLLLILGFFARKVEAAEILNKELVNLYPSQSYRLTVNSTGHSYGFQSDDTSVAMVDEKGFIIALSPGFCHITCQYGSGESSTCLVNVLSGRSPEKVSLSEQSLVLTTGERWTLQAAVFPSDAAETAVLYESSDDSIAKVSQNGEIEALQPGVAVITAESSSSAVYASCLIRVMDESGKSDFGAELKGVLYTASGEKMANTTVELKNRSSAVRITTDEDGCFRFTNRVYGQYLLTVSGNAAGGFSQSANVTVSSRDERLSCIVSDSGVAVLYGTEDRLNSTIRDITLSAEEIRLNTGDQFMLSYAVAPKQASSVQPVFSVSDKSVVTVDQTGRIRAINEGMAEVYVSSRDGRVTKSCMVTVTRDGLGNLGWLTVLLLMLILTLGGILVVSYREKQQDGEKL